MVLVVPIVLLDLHAQRVDLDNDVTGTLQRRRQDPRLAGTADAPRVRLGTALSPSLGHPKAMLGLGLGSQHDASRTRPTPREKQVAQTLDPRPGASVQLLDADPLSVELELGQMSNAAYVVPAVLGDLVEPRRFKARIRHEHCLNPLWQDALQRA